MKNVVYLLVLSMFVSVGCASKQETNSKDSVAVQTEQQEENTNSNQESNKIAEFNAFAADNAFYFGFDKAVIKNQKLVKEYVKRINNLGSVSLTISGYCDNKGSATYNKALGMRRAVAVKQALLENGLNKNVNIRVISYGEEKYKKYVKDVKLNDEKNRKATIEA